MGQGTRLINFLISIAATIVICTTAAARPPTEAEFLAGHVLGDELGEWMGTERKRISSVGIFSVHVNTPLESDYATFLQTSLIEGILSHGIPTVIPCPECHVPQVVLKDGNLVVFKGTPDPETLKRVGKNYAVNAFLTVDVFRTGLNLIANATLYENPSGKILNAATFTIPALNFSESSVQVLLTFGLGQMPGVSGQAQSYETSGNIFLLEELGFGKGGLNIGMLMGDQTLIYVNPSLSLRGRFGYSGLAWSVNLGAGYGFTAAVKGIAVRASYELYLGALATLGAEGLYFIPQGQVTNPVPGYIGLHIGLSFGR